MIFRKLPQLGILLACTVALAGCDWAEVLRHRNEARKERLEREIADVKSKLPPGCEFHILGEVLDAKLFMTSCPNKQTTTTNLTKERYKNKTVNVNSTWKD